jgi:uncharacterized membrane protein required for colicin V production
LNWVDFFIIVVLVVALANGYRRGVFKEISTFIGLIFTIVFAIYYADWLALKGEGRLNISPSLLYLISFCFIFVFTQVILKLLGHFFYKMVKIVPLKKYDKIFGGSFGLIKGAFALSLIFLMFIFFPSFQSFNQSIDTSVMASVFRKFVPVTFDLTMQLHPRKAKFIDKVKNGVLGSKASQYAENPNDLVEEGATTGFTDKDIQTLDSIDRYFGQNKELAKREE